MPKVKIIINADDLGASKIINSEIEKLIMLGKISSATILSNGPAFNEVKAIVDKYPQISFGVHLNIVEFKSLTNSIVLKKHNLIDDNGNFIYQRIFKIENYTKELLDAIKEEFRIQIKTLISEGINISHIDGHQQCHSIYELYGIIRDLSNEFNIKYIRRKIPPRSLVYHIKSKLKKEKTLSPSTSEIENNSKTIYFKIYNYITKIFKYILWMYKSKKQFKMTDLFFSYSYFCENVRNIKYKNKTIELMCHPGLKNYDFETKMIEQGQLIKLIDFSLITYNNK